MKDAVHRGSFSPADVNDYYNKFTGSYLSTYGHVIQAFRPSDTTELHKYIIKSAGLQQGDQILDAGCGVAGPAIFFAKALDTRVDGITVSEEQIRIGNELVKKNSLESKVHLKTGDFHYLQNYYRDQKFDKILFLESLGHAQDPEKVLKEAKALLKTGGSIYIKDFFPFEIDDVELKKKHQKVIDNINKSYCYNVLDLHETISQARRSGLEITFIKKFDFKDDITARSAFEAQNEVDLFGEMEEFRVAEWLELKFTLPEWPLF